MHIRQERPGASEKYRRHPAGAGRPRCRPPRRPRR